MPDQEQTEAINFEGPEIPGDPCPFASVAISMLSKEGSHNFIFWLRGEKDKYFAVGMRLGEVLEMDITFVGKYSWETPPLATILSLPSLV